MKNVAKFSGIGLLSIMLSAGAALSGCTGETDSGDDTDTEQVAAPARQTQCQKLADVVTAAAQSTGAPLEPN